MACNIVTESELKTGLNIGTRPALQKYLIAKRIPYEVNPKGEIWTVEKALELHLLGQAEASNDSTDLDDFEIAS